MQGYTARCVAPEVLASGDGSTQEADIFGFGMVVVEVSRFPTLVLDVEGWVIWPTLKRYLRPSQESLHSASSRPQLLRRRLWTVSGQTDREDRV